MDHQEVNQVCGIYGKHIFHLFLTLNLSIFSSYLHLFFDNQEAEQLFCF